MAFFIGNIDVNNIDLVNDSAKEVGVKYEISSYSTFSDNNIKKFSFNPVFCESKDDAIKLLRAYFKIAESLKAPEKFENDSYMLQRIDIENA